MKGKLIGVLILASLLISCSAVSPTSPSATPSAAATETVTPAVQTTPAETPTQEPTESPTPVPTPTPTPAPPPSLTSGLPSGKDYKPVNVQIENMPEARPQAGLSQADIVYECLMEGRSMTRFQCVFNDNLPSNVGPVRSCRLYFVDIAAEYKGVLAFFGGPSTTVANIYPKINRTLKAGNLQVAADGISGRYGTKSNLYWRTKERHAPHNVYTDVSKHAALLEKPVEPVSHFLFNEEAVYTGEDINNIEVRYNARTVDTKYIYDKAAQRYNRFIGADPMIDANTNSQVTVKNVIVQYAKTVGLGTSKGHIDIKLIGTGKADVFVNGKHIAATWKRATQDDITKYYDDAGKEIELQPGNTWIQIIPSTWTMIKTGDSISFHTK